MLSKPTDKIRERAAEDARSEISTEVEELRWTRSVIVQTKTRIEELVAQLAANPLYAEMKELQGTLSVRKVEEREEISAIRAMALTAYHSGMCDGKKVVPGVGIRVSKRFKYDVADALAWCLRPERPGVAEACTQTVLKMIEYEAIAGTLGGPIEEVEIASATIAKDLDEVLGCGTPAASAENESRIVQFPPAGETKAEEEPPF